PGLYFLSNNKRIHLLIHAGQVRDKNNAPRIKALRWALPGDVTVMCSRNVWMVILFFHFQPSLHGKRMRGPHAWEKTLPIHKQLNTHYIRVLENSFAIHSQGSNASTKHFDHSGTNPSLFLSIVGQHDLRAFFLLHFHL